LPYLHFIVPEENIGLEVVDGLIDDVHFGRIDSWRRRTSKLGADRQKGDIANALFVVQQLRVVSLKSSDNNY